MFRDLVFFGGKRTGNLPKVPTKKADTFQGMFYGILRHLGIFMVFEGFLGMLGNRLKTQDLRVFGGSSWCFLDLLGIPWNSIRPAWFCSLKKTLTI